jgi:hypothetical protein
MENIHILNSRLEARRKHMVLKKKRAKSRFQRLRAECIREQYFRDKPLFEAEIRREKYEASQLRMPVRSVQMVQLLASMPFGSTRNRLSLIPPEVATIVACHMVAE